MADDGSGPDWLGLLKWSLAQTDGTSETESRPMGQEDVSFLTKVMEELVADEPKRRRRGGIRRDDAHRRGHPERVGRVHGLALLVFAHGGRSDEEVLAARLEVPI